MPESNVLDVPPELRDAYREVCAAVRDWQSGLLTADDVTAVAMAGASGDADKARFLMKKAVAWWQDLSTYRDRNGNPIDRNSSKRDVPSTDYGMEWDPSNPSNPDVVAFKQWDGWDGVPLVQWSGPLNATEGMLSSHSIGKVVTGGEPFREGYDPRILIDKNGQAYVIDGHHRVAMHYVLGHSGFQAHVLDLRAQKTAGPGSGVIPWRVRNTGPININQPWQVIFDPMAARDVREVLYPDEQRKVHDAVERIEHGQAQLEPKQRELEGTFGVRVDEDCRLLLYPHVDGTLHAYYVGRHDYDEAARRWVNPPDMQRAAGSDMHFYPSINGRGKYHALNKISETALCGAPVILDSSPGGFIVVQPGDERVHPIVCRQCLRALQNQTSREARRRYAATFLNAGWLPMPVIERFWDKVEVGQDYEDWLWMGSVSDRGYGRFRVPGGVPEVQWAHRVSFQIAFGPLSSNFVVDHDWDKGCRSRRCVNPHHLTAVTAQENTIRGEERSLLDDDSQLMMAASYAGGDLGRIYRVYGFDRYDLPRELYPSTAPSSEDMATAESMVRWLERNHPEGSGQLGIHWTADRALADGWTDLFEVTVVLTATGVSIADIDQEEAQSAVSVGFFPNEQEITLKWATPLTIEKVEVMLRDEGVWRTLPGGAIRAESGRAVTSSDSRYWMDYEYEEPPLAAGETRLYRHTIEQGNPYGWYSIKPLRAFGAWRFYVDIPTAELGRYEASESGGSGTYSVLPDSGLRPQRARATWEVQASARPPSKAASTVDEVVALIQRVGDAEKPSGNQPGIPYAPEGHPLSKDPADPLFWAYPPETLEEADILDQASSAGTCAGYPPVQGRTWKDFSRARGYTEEEIADYERLDDMLKRAGLTRRELSQSTPGWVRGSRLHEQPVEVLRAVAARLLQSSASKMATTHLAVDGISDSVMVGFFLGEEIGTDLAIPGGEKPEEMHVTLAFLGDKADLNEDDVLEVMGLFAEGAPPIVGTVSGYGVFQTDGGQVLYASVDVPGLEDWRHDMVELLGASGAPVAHDHGFTAHITLKYLDEGEEVPDVDIEPFEIEFECVTLAWGTEHTDFALTGEPYDPDAVAGDVGRVATSGEWHNSDGFSLDATDEELAEHLLTDHHLPERGIAWERSDLPTELDEIDQYHLEDHSRNGECGAHEGSLRHQAATDQELLDWAATLDLSGYERGEGACLWVPSQAQNAFGLKAVEGYYYVGMDLIAAIGTGKVFSHCWCIMEDGISIFDPTAGQFFPNGPIARIYHPGDPVFHRYIQWKDVPEGLLEQVEDIVQSGSSAVQAYS